MRDWHVFVESLEILKVYFKRILKEYFNFETNFLESFFKKLEYRFLVESTENERATFPYKTALSESNARMESKKWNYHKEWSFASNYFIFSKILFQFKNFKYRADLM